MLVLRRSAAGELPEALIPPRPIATTEQRRALERLGAAMQAGDGRYRALQDIVARTRPRFTDSIGGSVQATDLAEQRRRAAALDASYLIIQGPPGTGKTWTGARLVVDLIRRGRRVGVAATSHKAIHNLLDQIEEAAETERVSFHGLKKSSAGIGETEYASASIRSIAEREEFVTAATGAQLLAGTVWLFARGELDGTLDTLVIDEAGQVALADALAIGTAARNVVLLGDPQQLAQVSQGTHPEGTDASVLEHLLAEHPTVPPDRGIFLDRTRRMHPGVCRFISEVVYEGRLDGLPEVARQDTDFGTGLRFLPVEHIGNVASAPEEAERVAREIRRMRAGSWTRRDGVRQPLDDSDFMVVAPYNAQVRQLRRALEGGRTRWCAGGDRGQVPGTRGSDRLLLDGDLQCRGRAAQPGVPVFAQSPQRGRLARNVPGMYRREPAPAGVACAHHRADAADQRALSLRRDGGPALKRAGPSPARPCAAMWARPRSICRVRPSATTRASRSAPRTTATSGCWTWSSQRGSVNTTIVRTDLSPELGMPRGQEPSDCDGAGLGAPAVTFARAPVQRPPVALALHVAGRPPGRDDEDPTRPGEDVVDPAGAQGDLVDQIVIIRQPFQQRVQALSGVSPEEPQARDHPGARAERHQQREQDGHEGGGGIVQGQGSRRSEAGGQEQAPPRR